MTTSSRHKKPAKQPTRCHCRTAGCVAETMRTFAPGHDARLVRALSDMVVAGKTTEEVAVRQLHERGGTEALAAKLMQTIANKRTRFGKTK